MKGTDKEVMSFTDNGGLSAADVAAVMGNNGSGSFGWGDGSIWIIILFLFAFMGNGWGNNYGGTPAVTNDVQRGFDQSALINGQNNILQSLNTIGMSMQNGFCDNRAGIADIKYTVATEACADRAAVTNALRDVIASNTANTQAILDKMCQQEMEALKTQNANLRTQLNMANLNASQTAQTARILADNAAQTSALEQYLNPTPIPAYVVQNPNCCGSNFFNGNCCGA